MPDYISFLRSHICHEKILMPSTACLILNDRDEILLQKRADTKTWGYPGGCLDMGETILEGAKREVQEETGLTVSDLELFGIFSGREKDVTYPNKDQVTFVECVFVTRSFVGEMKIDAESLEQKFFPWNQLPEDRVGSQRGVMELFQQWMKEEVEIPVVW